MKKYLLISFLLIIISLVVNGQTNVSGGIYSDTTWTKANSPYIVVDTVVVFPGVTLTIEPGVVVKFADNKRLEIRAATLIAEGMVTDSITFTSNSATPDSGIWGGIYLNSTLGNMQADFNYCNFSYASCGIYCKLNYYFIPTLKNSLFYKNITGINGAAFSRVDSCNFTENSNGLYQIGGITNYCNISHNQFGILDGISPTVTNSIINSNQVGFKDCSEQRIKNCIVDSNQIGINTLWFVKIDSSIIRKNQIGIFADRYSSGSLITNSSIDSNSVAGIYFVENYGESVINCELKGNGIGIIDTGVTRVNTFTKNIIESNGIGILLDNSIDSFYCNKICNSTLYDLKYIGKTNSNIANNYWCTTDSISTQAVIFDGNDSAGLGVVNFMPFDTVQCYLCTYIFIAYNFPQKEPSCSTCSDGIATVNPTSGKPPYSYVWNTIPVQTTQTATGLSNGLYKVCITDSTGCSECDSVDMWWGENVSEIIGNQSLSLFPNPASDKITISNYSFSDKEARVEIYNMMGEKVFQSEIKNEKSEMDVSWLAKGIYIIQLIDGERVFRGKMIKE